MRRRMDFVPFGQEYQNSLKTMSFHIDESLKNDLNHLPKKIIFIQKLFSLNMLNIIGHIAN